MFSLYMHSDIFKFKHNSVFPAAKGLKEIITLSICEVPFHGTKRRLVFNAYKCFFNSFTMVTYVPL